MDRSMWSVLTCPVCQTFTVYSNITELMFKLNFGCELLNKIIGANVRFKRCVFRVWTLSKVKGFKFVITNKETGYSHVVTTG